VKGVSGNISDRGTHKHYRDAFNHASKRGGGFTPKLTKKDTIDYLAKLSAEAARYGMSTGLKNAEELLDQAGPYVHFAVNEECASMADSEGCAPYEPFLLAGKPVFHIEYVTQRRTGKEVTLTSTNRSLQKLTSKALEDLYCQRTVMGNKRHLSAHAAELLRNSTVIKELALGGFTLFCEFHG
jgi:hypothetical protein